MTARPPAPLILVVDDDKDAVFLIKSYLEEQPGLVVLAAAADGIPQVMEPEKCAEWRWCPWGALPEPRFLSIQHLLELGYRPPGVV